MLTDYDAVLASTYAQATAANRQLALEDQRGAFGSYVRTFPDWIDALWEACGDGRRPISTTQRQLLTSAVVRAHVGEHLLNTPNLSWALAKLVSQGLGLPTFTEGRAAASLSPAELELLEAADAYAEGLRERGLIERGEILAWLAGNSDKLRNMGAGDRPLQVKVLEDAPLSFSQQWFFDACSSNIELTHTPALPEPLQRISDDIDLQFAFPAGAYAQPQVLIEAIEDACTTSKAPAPVVVVAARNPLHLYTVLSGPLAEQGITSSVRATQPFARTALGQLYDAMCRMLASSELPWDTDALMTVLHSPYLGLKKYTVWAWDAYVRSDRLLNRDTVLQWLTEGVPEEAEVPPQLRGGFATFKHVLDLARDPFNRQAHAALTQRLVQLHGQGAVDDEFLDQHMNAQSAMLEVIQTAEQLGLGREHLDEVLAHAQVSVARTTGSTQAGSRAQVEFCNQAQSSRYPSGSADTLVLTDLTSHDYPLNDATDAVEALLARLGITQTETALARERRRFTQLLQVPTRRVVLERILNDEEAEPRFPCAMLEELVDAYRNPEDIATGNDIDNTYRLPDQLQPYIRYQKGEDNLLENVAPHIAERLGAWAIDTPASRGALHSEVALHNAVYAREPHDDEPQQLVLSPTGIDLYRDCPYRYFIQRRLDTAGLDEDFGPRTRGTFLHEVMQEFYTQFGRKVTPENHAQAVELMFGETGHEGVFAQVRAAQSNKSPGRRYAALPGTSEEFQFETFRDWIAGWLEFETRFLPNFVPAAFEMPLKGIELGGCQINCYLDRLDVNPTTGQAVVVDYKGRLKKQYRPLDTHYSNINGWNEAGHIQAAVYAALLTKQIAEQGPLEINGYRVESIVGALYVSYLRNNKVSGAFDPAAVNADDIPNFIVPKAGALTHDGEYSFEAFMAEVDKRVEQVVHGIKAGQFEPQPSCDEACEYCSITTCEMCAGKGDA